MLTSVIWIIWRLDGAQPVIIHVSERSLRYRWGCQQAVKQPQHGATGNAAPRSAAMEMKVATERTGPLCLARHCVIPGTAEMSCQRTQQVPLPARMTTGGYGPFCSHWPKFEFRCSTYVGDAAVSRNEGTLSYLPQLSPSRTKALTLFWRTAACSYRPHRTAAPGCFQALADGIIDSLQCKGRSKSRVVAFLGQSSFCRHQHAIHVSIKPAHSPPSANGPPKFPRRFRFARWVGG